MSAFSTLDIYVCNSTKGCCSLKHPQLLRQNSQDGVYREYLRSISGVCQQYIRSTSGVHQELHAAPLPSWLPAKKLNHGNFQLAKASNLKVPLKARKSDSVEEHRVAFSCQCSLRGCRSERQRFKSRCVMYRLHRVNLEAASQAGLLLSLLPYQK